MRGSCLPSTCSNTDVEKLFMNFNLSVSVENEDCQTRHSGTDFDLISIFVIGFFAFILLLVVISTAYDYLTAYVYQSKANVLFSAFSVLKNGKKIFSVSKGCQEISCMSGLRVISMIWIVLGHVYLLITVYPVRNGIAAFQPIKDHVYDYILGGTKSVDTFFVLGGITLSYVYLSSAQHYKFNLAIFYLHRYLRLTPALGAVLLFYIGLLKFLNSGPYWPMLTNREINPCFNEWWKIILYINNFGETRCLSHSWYLAVDMQLYLISPIILLLLQGKPKLGLSLIGFLLGCVVLISFVITWTYNLDTNPLYAKNNMYLSMFYQKPYTRAAPWLIGIVVGYVIYKKKQNKEKFVVNPVLVVVFWVTSITILGLCGFYELHALENVMLQKIRNSFYNAFIHLFWGLAVGWVTLACTFGYGGIINTFLSQPIFQVLSRLTYVTYLIHKIIVLILTGNIQSSVYLSHLAMHIIFWGVYMYALFASLILSLAFESPIITIEKVLLLKKIKEKKSDSNTIKS